MKRFLVFLTSALLLLSILPTSAANDTRTGECHFYICRGKDHAPPSTDAAFLAAFGKNAFYRDLSADETGEKSIYLTFDAGYENGNVAKILDILKKENVPGAFFVLSHLVTSAPALVERMTEEGHLVCNHTAHHKNMARLDEAAFRAELEALETVYKETTGKSVSKYYRPPEGTFSFSNLASAEAMGYQTVFWSLAYCDWNDSVAPSPQKAMQILKDNTHPGAIVLLHPTSNINVEILDDMIAYWRSEGYTFRSLNEMG